MNGDKNVDVYPISIIPEVEFGDSLAPLGGQQMLDEELGEDCEAPCENYLYAQKTACGSVGGYYNKYDPNRDLRERVIYNLLQYTSYSQSPAEVVLAARTFMEFIKNG